MNQKLMLGTANFGNEYKGLRLPRGDCFRVHDTAWYMGIREIDTARSYGESEAIIAEFCKMTGCRFKVYTKGRSQEDFMISADILGSNLYAKLWHYQPGDTVDCAIDGISCYGDEWFDIYGETDLSIVQLPWNVLDRRHEQSVVCAAGYGLQTICRSIFMRGEAFNQPPVGGRPFWQWCLQGIPAFDYVIVGADTPEQLKEIATFEERFQMAYTDAGISYYSL